MKRLLSLLLALAMLLGLTACGGSSTSAVSGAAGPGAKADSAATEAKQDTPADPGPQDDTPAPAEDSGEPKELRVGTLDSTDNFDPCSNSDCGLGLMLVYDTVLKLNYETMEVEPCIATEWNWVDDTTLELTIREGVTFSNGDPLTPEDVLYSLSRFVFENDQFDPGYNVIDFDASGVDGSKLTLKLKEVDADFLLELTNDRWASVVNEEYVKANPDSFWDAPCGTGPYTCVENVDGSHSTYQRREDYWGELPSASTITVQNYSELTTMMADFETGALDLALDVGETDYLTAVDGGYGDDVQGKTFKTWPEMVDNVIPYIGGEDEKSEQEPLKVWGHVENGKIVKADAPAITAQCLRVPVSDGHTAAVFVKFADGKKPSMEQIKADWADFKGRPQELELPSAPKQFIHYFEEPDRPQAKLDRELEGGMAVSMGRLRPDTQYDYKFVGLSHNTLRGAAGGAVLLAELLCKKGYIQPCVK